MLGLDLTFQLILKLLLEIPVVASARYFLFDNNPLSARYLLLLEMEFRSVYLLLGYT